MAGFPRDMEHMLGPHAEVVAKQAAEGEVDAKVRADQPAGLQELFLQRRNDIRQNITRVMDNVNGLEDSIIRALNQAAELQTCRAQLALAQEEVPPSPSPASPSPC